ncbi:rod shape-determining protein MreD [Tangfeifania diversioriginum]|jgi:rod shape-determining protein MreD|uniref:Rod shape-determining protein MreD n=1 Tax=Tangfeifania diversioriginum TaxID=1168035 RepID=A0A1M6N1M4_9BACT|nr:rod shape-determining protein MreD [Tangfeifania diversioriginum]SHJ89562.1 rod shape-determining protein MreD [Tangfeifania diversioriginum]
MIRWLIKYVVIFVVLVLIQVLFLNQMQISGYLNPYIYILFVMLLPLSAPRYIVLLSGFLIGLTVDIFSNSLGLHAAATVFIAYIRPFIIRSISDREEEINDYPGLKQNKFSWFLYYSAVMVFFHHFILFYLEIFSFTQFFSTLLRVVLSSLLSVFVIVLSQFLIFRE